MIAVQNHLVASCLVRIAEPQKGKGRSYYTGLVTGAFEFREPYKLNRSVDASGRGAAIMTSKGLLLQRRKRGMGIETGQTETVRLNVVSNMKASAHELAGIRRDIHLLQKMAPDATKVLARVEDLSQELYTQSAAREVAKAKTMITKWNNQNDRKRLKDAVDLHGKLFKAADDSDW